MSIHKSLVPLSRLRRHRNVLTRRERVARLEAEGRWKPDSSIFGLPKVKNILMKMKAKATAKKEEAAAAGAKPAAGAAGGDKAAAGKAAAPAAKGAAPAAGAKGAAPAAKAPAKK